ncbi:MAG TPA: hemerythrin domain-containing protein [Casimicrobiaceae bacterium]|jgi:hemerythrin-like domain-containing protein|nr:hemerythrin domain-containing protein [Casimicrobiaceae bacterium]
MQPIRVIVDEHRSLAVVMHGMLYLIRDIRLCGASANFAVFDAMVRYMDTFVEPFHHPKEDAYLFRLLRLRYAGCGQLIDRLAAEHREGTERLRDLEDTLARYKQGESGGFAAFAQSAQAYAAFHWSHMRAEEDELLPLARTHLRKADWEEIDAAFTEHADPLLGLAKRECDALFRRIVALSPPPLGKPRAAAVRRHS